MKKPKTKESRRAFFQKSTLLAGGILGSQMISMADTSELPPTEGIYIIGPKKGYSPQIGTLLSTMVMMRTWVVQGVQNLTQEQLDFQLDDQSNSIGALLLHLAATERYYQLNTFEGMRWGSWDREIKKEWDVAMNLGAPARKKIKGHDIRFYLDKLKEVRDVTKAEFAKRDDDWLMESEAFFENKPTNNHCKWFHVCEHESNHNGQIKLIKKRMPS
ncbi:MAG: DinB family protein [Bacteroidota bacterium]